MSSYDKSKNINLQIRKLPYSILQKAASFLDDLDNRTNWRALIGAMPMDTYTQNDVNQFDRLGMQRGGSSAEALLQNLGQKCITVRQLIVYLEAIGNNEALELLKPDERVEITEQPSSSPVMAGGRVELVCRATGFPPPEYQWLRNGEEIRNACESTLIINNTQAKDSGKYSCIASNRLSAEKSNCVEIQVQDRVVGCQPPKITQHPISAVVPVGQQFSLSCQVENPRDCNYQWFKDGNKLRSKTVNEIFFDSFNFEHEGNYNCRAYNAKGDALTRLATLQAWAPEPPCPNEGIDSSSLQLTEKATDKVALVIGNRDYFNLPPNESPLVHTCGDAQSVAAILRKNLMNFKVFSLVNLTYEEMKKALSIYYELLDRGVYGLLYFAGHGFEDSGQNYMIPIDAMTDWTPDKAICVQKILQEMHKRGAKLNVFLLDICRKLTMTSNGYKREIYPYPPDAQSVYGFATCPGAEAYERKADANGLYMTHLLKNITKEATVEDMLKDVAADVENEVANDPDVWRMRPQYYSRAVKNFSLRDPIVKEDQESSKLRNQKWLEIHKLPQKHIFNVAHVGITVEIRFEHTNWLSNVILVCLRVLDLGEATMCDASLRLSALPKGLQECHFHPSTANKMRHVVPPQAEAGVVARAASWTSQEEQSHAPVPVERISEIYNIQRLQKNLSLTIELKYILRGSQEEQTKYEIKAFNLKEFGIVNAFAKANPTDDFQDDSLY